MDAIESAVDAVRKELTELSKKMEMGKARMAFLAGKLEGFKEVIQELQKGEEPEASANVIKLIQPEGVAKNESEKDR